MRPDHNWTGTLVLDSQGLSELLAGQESVTRLFLKSGEVGAKRVVSALTLVEAQHPRIDRRHLDYVLSGMDIVDATHEIAASAVKLLHSCGKHGHSEAIDAIVAATALCQPPPVLMLTSDPVDMQQLCDGQIRITAI